MSKNAVNYGGFILAPVKDFSIFTGFSCLQHNDTDRDLDDFLQNDAVTHCKDRVAITYALTPEDDITFPLAFATLQNDVIVARSADTLPAQCKSCEHVPSVCTQCETLQLELQAQDAKKLSSIIDLYPYSMFPAVKIGRIGVRRELHGKRTGSILLRCLKILMIEDNLAGCRFITVDARRDKKQKINVVPFYERNSFIQFPHTVRKKTSRAIPMYLDLGILCLDELYRLS